MLNNINKPALIFILPTALTASGTSVFMALEKIHIIKPSAVMVDIMAVAKEFTVSATSLGLMIILWRVISLPNV